MRVVLVIVAVVLGGCQSSVYKPGVPYHLSKINVGLASADASPRVVSLVQQDLERTAAARPAVGAPRVLDVTITQYHKKRPLQSFLVGDANRAGAHARILAPDSAAVEWQSDIVISDTEFINGVLGAMVAAGQDADAVEARLSHSLASKIAGAAYGSARPIPIPEAAPAPVPATAERQAPADPAPAAPEPTV